MKGARKATVEGRLEGKEPRSWPEEHSPLELCTALAAHPHS